MFKKLLLSYYKNTPTSLKEDEVGIVINDTVDVIFDTKILDINDVRIGYDFKLYLPDADVIDQDKVLIFYNELESFKTDLLSRSNIKSTVIDSLIPIFEDSYTKLRSHLESISYNYKFVPDTKDPLLKELNRFRRVVYLIEVEIVKANYRYYIDIIKSLSKTLILKIFFTTKEELISKPEKSLPFYIGDETPEVYIESIHFSTTTLKLYRYNGVKWVLIDNSAISDNYLDLIFSPSTPYSQKTFTETPEDYSKGDIYISSTFIKKATVAGASYKESDWTTITVFSEYDDTSFTAKLKELEDKINSLDLSGAKKLEEKLFQGDYIDPNIINIDNISLKLKSRWSTDFLDYLTKKELSFILNDFVTNRKLGLSTLAYKDKVSKRDLDNTILKDGFIDPALINSSYIEPDLSSLHTKIDDVLNISKGYLDHKIMNRLLGLSNLAYTDSVSFTNFDESLKNNNYLNLDLFDIDGLIIKGNFTTQDKLRQSEDRVINNSKNFFKSKILNKELGVSEIAYKEFISFYDLDGTIITGNFIKTELINADAIILNSGRTIRDEISFNTGKTLEDSTNYIQGLITRKELGVSDIAYKQLISFRDLDSTIITGNFIKTELINARAIVIGGPNGIPTDYIDEKNSQIIQKYSNLNVRVSEAYDLFNELTADATKTKDLIFRIVDDNTLTRAEIESLRLRYVELDKNRLSVLSSARIYNDDHSLDEYITLYNNTYTALNEVIVPILESTEDFVGVDSPRIISVFNDFFNKEANLQHAIIREAKEASQSYTDKVRYDLKFDVNKLMNDLITTKSTLTYLFQDGIVTSEEMAVLRSLLKQLEESHVNLTSRYSSIYNDSAFRDTALKTELYNSYQNFSNNYSTLVNTIQTIIDDKIVTEIESQSFIQKMEDYHTSVQDLADKLDKSLISIINSSVEKAKTDIRAEIGETLSGYVNLVTYNNDINNIQRQLDGAILNWFLDGVPTLNNNPANQWTTDAIKDEHLGDIYYDLQTNLAYRFIKEGSVYKWSFIEDADASLLLGKIKEAKDIADGKRRIFLVQPYPPYDAGDLWITSTIAGQGDLLKCIVSRESGGYQSTDWVLATKYTDDTVASDALSKVQDITADNKLTPVEKRQLLIIYDEIISTHNRILSDIQVFNVPTNDPNYIAYINYYTSDVVPNFTNWVSDINNTTNISPGSIESILNIYFTYRGKVEKLISDVKKQRDTTLDMYLGLADEVNRAKLQGQSLLVGGYIKTDFIDTDTLLIRGLQDQPTLSQYISSTNSKISSIESTQISQGDVIAAKNKTTVSATAPVNPAKGDIWIDTSRNNVIKVYGTSWEIYQDNTKTRTFVQSTKPLDPSPASVFSNGDIWIDTSTPRNIIHVYNGNDFIKYDDNQVTADMIRINDIANDNKVTPVEKSNLKKEYEEIIAEYQVLSAKASQYSISIGTDTTGYKGKYNQIINYLNPLLQDLTTTSDIFGDTLRLYFKQYLSEKVILDKLITDEVNSLAQQGYDTAKNAELAAQTANTNISYILADEYITPNEKSDLYKEVTVIKSEYPEVIARANSLSIDSSGYTQSYNNLLNFIQTNQIFGANGADISFTTKLVDSSNNSLTPTLRNLFTTYYTEKQRVINSSIGKVDSNAIINLDKLRKFITPDNTLDQLNDLAAAGNTLIKGGKINTEFIEAKTILLGDGINLSRVYSYGSHPVLPRFNDPDFRKGINNLHVYDNCTSGKISFTREQRSQNNPTVSGYEMKFTSEGVTTCPAYGGFYFGHSGPYGAAYVTKIIANIPEGYYIQWHSNSIGNNGKSLFITDTKGTGKFKEYLHYVEFGDSGTIEATNYYAFSSYEYGTGNNTGPIEVRIAYATVYDLSKDLHEDTKDLFNLIYGVDYKDLIDSSLRGTTLIRNGYINTDLVNTNALIVRNGDQSLGTLIVGNSLNTGLIAANSIKSDMIDTRGLTIKDSSGNVIFGSGKKLDLLNNTENAPSSWVNQNITLQSDGTLNGAGGGKVTIRGLGYTGALDATLGATVGKDVKIITTSSGTQTLVQDSFINQWNKMSASNVNTFMQSATIGDAHIINLNAAKVQVGNTSLTIDVNGVSKIRTEHIDAQTFIVNNNLTTVSQSQEYANNAAQQAVDSVQIGGRNYILKSKAIEGYVGYGTKVNDKFGEVMEYSRPEGGGDFQFTFNMSPDSATLKNTEVVFFVIAKDMVGGGDFAYGGWTNTFSKLTAVNNQIDLGDGWKMYWVTFTTDESGIASTSLFGINSIRGTWRFFAVGVLKGNKPLDWTRAPEDIDSNIQAVRTETQTRFAVLETEISSKVSTSDFNALGQRVGSAESTIIQHANQIAQRVTSSTFQQFQSDNNTAISNAKNEAVNYFAYRDGRRDTNDLPQYYNDNYPAQEAREFKHASVLGISSPDDYIGLVTKVPYLDESGNTYSIIQTASANNRNWQRTSNGMGAWTTWKELEDSVSSTNKANNAQNAAIGYTDNQIGIVNNSITTLTSRVTTNETSITQLSNSISLKANQTQVDTLVSIVAGKADIGTVTSLQTRINEAEIKLQPDQINLVVKQQIDTKINDVQVGGINYYSNRSTFINGYLVTPIKNNENGFNVTGSESYNGYVHLSYVVRGNGLWTISGYARGNQGEPAFFEIGANDIGLKRFYVNTDNNWTYFEHTVDVTNYTPEIYNFFRFYNLSWHYFFFKDIVVNKGSKAVRDAINIEDVESDINNLSQRVGSTETSITQLTDSINLKAEKSVVENSINSITTRLNSAEAKITPDAINFTVQSQIDNKVKIASERTTLLVDARGLDQNKYYPIVINLPGHKRVRITVRRTLDSNMGVPSYSTHASGFSVSCVWSVQGSGWGSNEVNRIIESFEFRWTNDVSPVGSIGQLGTSSQEYIYVRGGSMYDVVVEGFVDADISLKTSTYTNPYNTETLYIGNSVTKPEPTNPSTEKLKSEFTISPGGISMLGKTISLAGMVTFSSLDSSTQSVINDKVAINTFNSYQASVNTQLSSYNTALQDVQSKTNNLTTINGGVIQTGVTLVGNGTTNTAFISGVIDNGVNSIVIGAGGGGYNDKNNAPFRVNQAGKVWMMDAYVKGVIEATSGSFSGTVNANSGTIGGFYILNDRLSSSPTGTGKRHDIISSTTGQAYDEWYDENNILVAREGFIEGVQQKVWYDATGKKIAAIGQKGIISYVTTPIPESYITLDVVGSLASEKPLTSATAIKRTFETSMLQLNSDGTFEFKDSSKTLKYYYNAGGMDDYRQYEGYKNSQNRTDNIADGWYVVSFNIWYPGEGIEIIYIQNGLVDNTTKTLIYVSANSIVTKL